MDQVTLWKNTLLEYRDEDGATRTERILWINPSGDYIVTIDINRENKRALPLWRTREEIESALEASSVRVVETDPYAVLLIRPEPIPKTYLEHRDRAWNVIETLVEDKSGQIFDPGIRGPLITKIMKEKEVRKGYIYDALRRYWQRGQAKNALLPLFQECGAKGKERVGKTKLGRPSARDRIGEVPAGVIMTDEVRSKLQRGYKKYFVSGKEKTLEKALQRTREDFFNIGFEEKYGVNDGGIQTKVLVPLLPEASRLPTFVQFRYIHQKYADTTHLLTSREGERRFALRRRAILGESTHMADGPCSLAQGDATIGDIHLVSSRDRSRLIGRPVIYVIIDVFTRLILGFSVSLEGPSWLGMMLALENAMTDKVAFCKEHGIDITQEEWPSQHLPEELLGDRGELEGYNATHLANSLDIPILNTPPHRCDWKGIVEQNFRLVSDEIIHWKPGAVYQKRERGEKDTRLEACLTLQEFRQLMILCILKHNNYHRMDWYKMDDDMVTDHVEPYPIELWNWGIRHRVGHLRKKPPEIVRLSLLAKAQASVTELGICFQGVYYTCDLAIREQWFVKARLHGRWPISIAYDPRKLDTIYLPDKGRLPELCELIEREKRTYQGRDWFEILDYFELKKQAEEASRTSLMQQTAEFNAKTDAIVNEAKEKTEQAVKGQSKSTRLKNIRENRKTEREDERASDAWQLGERETSTPPSDTSAGASPIQAETDSYVPPDQSLDDIRRLRQEKWMKSQERREKTNG
jgi:putative transposase